MAPELPEKIEQILYLNLTDDQQKQYDQRRKLAEDELNQLVIRANEDDADENPDSITSTRQACCDPRLIELTLNLSAHVK